ncbi:MAG: hypothetical protein Sylvanvirus7_10 [Sylvanvirus sp.]|uniref:Uncharacterized protein n=1 Tax=Sylvanvirus sp. TaxID=2487774 RepID=A0A3G5AHM9_9VIRU|nr:MAG: hypothetical protein Sylvanvirus7_10 [Sylvanvirus sp.]
MANLSQACTIFLDVQYLQQTKELLDLKAAISRELFLDNLQSLLDWVNEDIVKCGCERCSDFIGGNYPKHDNYFEEHNKWGPLSLETNPVEDIKGCLLFKWFKSTCEEFKVIVPRDEQDNPSLHLRSFKLTTCLGEGVLNLGLGDFDQSWRQRIKRLPYATQVNTVYRMLYAMTVNEKKRVYPDVEMISFTDWFRVKNHSLLP